MLDTIARALIDGPGLLLFPVALILPLAMLATFVRAFVRQFGASDAELEAGNIFASSGWLLAGFGVAVLAVVAATGTFGGDGKTRRDSTS